MKIYFFSIALIFLFTHSSFSQIAESEEVQILNILDLSQTIKANLNNYSKNVRIIKNNEYNTAYRDESDLILITTFKRDNNQNLFYEKEWYFQNRKLIFTQQVTTDEESDKVIDREKMFFENEQLFAWKQSEKYMDRNSDKFKKTAEALTDYSLKLRIDNMLE